MQMIIHSEKEAVRVVDFGSREMVILVFLMSAVTYLPRVLPMLLLSRRKLPEPFERWLSYVPVAVLSALLAPTLFAPEGHFDFAVNTNPGFWVAMPVFVIAALTRNLFTTVLFGMLLVALFRYLLP